MNTPDERDRIGTPDDLTVARLVHARALERAIRLRLELRGALRVIEQAQRALEQGNRDAVAKSLHAARQELSRMSGRGMQVRIDGQVKSDAVISPATHRFLGLWRPPLELAPASPQELNCVAVVCTCLEHLADGVQIRQHWETGCFDLPEFQTDPPLRESWEDLLKELDS